MNTNQINRNSEVFVLIISNNNYESIIATNTQEFSDPYNIYIEIKKINESNYNTYELFLVGVDIINDNPVIKKIPLTEILIVE